MKVGSILRYRGGNENVIANIYDIDYKFFYGNAPCVSYLPLYKNLDDKCGNVWTAYGTPHFDTDFNECDLNGSTYLQCDGGIEFGGRPFTINFCGAMFNTTAQWGAFFSGGLTFGSRPYQISIGRYNKTNCLSFSLYNSNGVGGDYNTGIEIVGGQLYSITYTYEDGVVKCYVANKLMKSFNLTVERAVRKCRIGVGHTSTNYKLVGSINNFKIIDGIALTFSSFQTENKVEENILIRHNGANCFIPLTSNEIDGSLVVHRNSKDFYAII